jgi:hypothetical protein
MLVSLLNPASSVTTKVKVTVPVWLAAGVSVRVQFPFASSPQVSTSPIGARFVSDETAWTLNWLPNMALSVIVKGKEEVTLVKTNQKPGAVIIGASLYGWS